MISIIAMSSSPWSLLTYGNVCGTGLGGGRHQLPGMIGLYEDYVGVDCGEACPFTMDIVGYKLGEEKGTILVTVNLDCEQCEGQVF